MNTLLVFSYTVCFNRINLDNDLDGAAVLRNGWCSSLSADDLRSGSCINILERKSNSSGDNYKERERESYQYNVQLII